MNSNMKNAKNLEKLAALRLAEIQATDKEDLENCVNDMTRSASLDKSEALVIANAIRAKYLPNVMREAGIELDEEKMPNFEDDGEETVDFANDEEEDIENDMDMDDMSDDDEDEITDLDGDGEADDDREVAEITIEVPASMVEAAQQAIMDALDNLLGGEDTDSDDDDMDLDLDSEEEEDEEDMDDHDSDDIDEEDSMHKKSNGDNKMTRQALAARRAKREEILKKIASEIEEYPAATTSVSYSDPDVNFEGEKDFPTFKFDNDGEGDKVDYADSHIPTNMPESLEFPDVYKASKFVGTPELDVLVDWKKMEIPSKGDAKLPNPAIPTKNPMPHKTTRSVVSAKELMECVTCGHKMHLAAEEMESANCPMCEGKEAATVNLPADTELNVTASNEASQKVAALDKARISTAYSCSTKLALAGLIETAEVDAYAEQMLNDNLKADAMIRQTKLMLKSAQASSERVAAAAAEKMNRTASTLGISTTPAFNGNSITSSAAQDIQTLLRGTWTGSQIED